MKYLMFGTVPALLVVIFIVEFTIVANFNDGRSQLHVPLQSHRIENGHLLIENQRNRGFSVDLKNYFTVMYTGTIFIGNPGQPFEVVFGQFGSVRSRRCSLT